MKNFRNFTIEPEDLIKLRGETGEVPCGEGFTRYFCTIWQCMECEPYSGPACVPNGENANLWVEEHVPAWHAVCI